MKQINRSRTEGSGIASAITFDRVTLLILGRQGRTLVFPKSLFGEPAWDMILELYVANFKDHAITVTHLCRASGEAQSTALRWIAILEQHEYLSKAQDPSDGRRVLVRPTSKLIAAVERIYELHWHPATEEDEAGLSAQKNVQTFCQGIGCIEAGTVSDGAKTISILAGVKQIQIGRRKRHAVFPRSFFGEPAWDILLEAYVSYQEGCNLTVTDLCVASGEPQSTALRWIAVLEQNRYLSRSQDPSDKRRVFIHTTAKTIGSIDQLFTLYSVSRNVVDRSAFPSFKA